PNGLITLFNPAAEELLGYSAEEVVGRPAPEVWDHKNDPALIEYASKLSAETGTEVEHGFDALVFAARNGLAQTIELTWVHKDGTRIPVLLTVSAIRDASGEITAFLGVARDITDIKAAETDRIAAQVADKQREATSQFLATMNHEIRTPLNALVNMISLIKADGHERIERRDFDVIETSANNLLSLVSSVLEFSKNEAAQFELEERELALWDLLQEITALFSASAKKAGVNLRLAELPLALRVPLIGDAARLRQMLSNLVSNAIKFTQAGGMVGLHVDELEASSQGCKRLRFVVDDNGRGIAAEDLDKLFKPFSQVQSYQKRDQGGTGLGLSIVKQMAEQMGGTVGASSQPGQGSSFWFEVELPLADIDTASADEQADTPGQLVLGLWGLNRAKHKLISEYAKEFGWQTTAFFTAEEIYQATQKASGPAIVVTDQDWETDQFWQGEKAPAPEGLALISPPDVASSIAGLELFDAVNEACVEHGYDTSYLLERTTITFGKAPWLARVKVLVVDDQNLNLTSFIPVIERVGAICLTAGSGMEALEVVKGHLDDLDVVLMDLQMPEMDGCEATMAIRKLKGAKGLPIIALTAGATNAERERALASGMNDFCIKPAKPEDLIRTVRKHVKHYRKEPIRFFEKSKR
ncbi:PAS domain-containing hybrid sensor histidine kinase/response regulator, partial [Altererythrobacter litoralis]|nr:ATP-binding protein [Erythrobacteraceae bacterium 1XM1-14]